MFTVSCPNCAATYNLDESKVGPNGRKLKCAKCQHVWVAMAPGAPAPAVEEPKVEVPAAEVPAPAATVAPEVTAEVKEAIAAAEAGETPAKLEEVPEVVKVGVPPEKDPALDEHMPDFDFKLPEIDQMASVGRMGGLRMLAGGEKWLWLALILCVVGILGGVWTLLGGSDERPEGDDLGITEKVEDGVSGTAVAAPVPAARQEAAPPEGLELHDVKAEFVTGDKSGVTFEVKGTLKNTGKSAVALPGVQVELIDKKGEVADVWPVKLAKENLGAGAELAWGVSFTNPPTEEMAGWRAVFVK